MCYDWNRFQSTKLSCDHIMSSLREGLEAAVTAAFCTLSAPVEKTVALGEQLYDSLGFPGGPSGPTPLGQGLRASRNVFCNQPPDSIGDAISEPFQGGQCPGTQYEITATLVINGSPANGWPRSRTEPGPITYNPGSRPDGGPRASFFNGDGDEFWVSGAPPGDELFFTDISVVTADGSPDTCGNPDPVAPPYRFPDFTTNTDVPYVDDDGNSVTLPVGLVYAPVEINNDFQIEVPTRIEINPDVFIDAVVNLDTGDISFTQNNNISVLPPEQDPSIEPNPEAPPGSPPGQQPEETTGIIAVVVQVDEIFPGYRGQVLNSDTPGTDLYGPRLASVSFRCQGLVNDGLFWTEDVDIKYLNQVVVCPVPWGAVDVRVTPQFGIALTYGIVRGETERSLLLRAAS